MEGSVTRSYGLPLEEAREYLYSFDLDPVINRMVEVEGWPRKAAIKASDLYRNFLFIRKKYINEGSLPPSYEIDEVWHAHVLLTKNYVEFCDIVFGYYLHHNPHMTESSNNFEWLSRRFEKTQVLHKTEFGSYIYHIKRRPIRLRPLFRKIIKLFVNIFFNFK